MLLRKVFSRFLIGILLMALFVFLPAGTFSYYNGWLMLALIFFPMTSVGIYFYKNDPAFLERRMRTHEKEKEQKLIIKLAYIPYLIGFLLPGFDHRFGWSAVPVWLVIFASLLFLLSYFAIFLVFKANSYASRVVEVEKEQKVIDTGPYALVRHPMYTANSILTFCVPVVLGSYYGLIPFLMLPVVFVFRLLNEEEVLKRDLPGYTEYCQKVKYRLIPFVW